MKLEDIILSEGLGSGEVTTLNSLINESLTSQENAQKLYDFIEDKCPQWLSNFGGLDGYLQKENRFYRGLMLDSDVPNRGFYKPVRPDRRPKNTLAPIHDMLVDYLKKHGAVANRDNSAFVTKDKMEAMNYGAPFVIFPVGSFNYTWIEGLDDFTFRFNRSMPTVTDEVLSGMSEVNIDDPEDMEFVRQTFEYVKDKFMDGNVRVDTGLQSIRSDEEILIKTDGMIYLNEIFIRNWGYILKGEANEAQ